MFGQCSLFFYFRPDICDQHEILNRMMYLSQKLKKNLSRYFSESNTSFCSEFDADSEYMIFFQKYWGPENGLIRTGPFHPWSPSGICEKMNLMKTSILLLSYAYFCPLVAFYEFWTWFPESKWLYNKIHFFTYPWGRPGVKIWPKKKVAETI